jgi:hypothetical protein
MTYATYEHQGRRAVGELHGDSLVPLFGLAELGPDTSTDVLEGAPRSFADAVSTDIFRLLPVVPHPTKIICVATNYRDALANPDGVEIDGVGVIHNAVEAERRPGGEPPEQARWLLHDRSRDGLFHPAAAHRLRMVVARTDGPARTRPGYEVASPPTGATAEQTERLTGRGVQETRRSGPVRWSDLGDAARFSVSSATQSQETTSAPGDARGPSLACASRY